MENEVNSDQAGEMPFNVLIIIIVVVTATAIATIINIRKMGGGGGWCEGGRGRNQRKGRGVEVGWASGHAIFTIFCWCNTLLWVCWVEKKGV